MKRAVVICGLTWKAGKLIQILAAYAKLNVAAPDTLRIREESGFVGKLECNLHQANANPLYSFVLEDFFMPLSYYPFADGTYLEEDVQAVRHERNLTFVFLCLKTPQGTTLRDSLWDRQSMDKAINDQKQGGTP
ncbi:MAG TPA: hypothetical protein VMX18_01025 [Candidatus Bipolaricaulota bacterium]|nr:hypothetical protein [Candidatus Bipolaricaulota bacterium]